LQQGKFGLNCGINGSAIRTVKDWNRSPGVAVEFPLLEILRTKLNKL